MRISDKMNFDQVNSNLGKNRAEISELQNKASLQKRVTKPSDDPLAATRVLAARTEIAGTKQFLKSVNQARSFLEYSDQSLGELVENLIRAKELALSQANDPSAGKASREIVATEVDQLFSQAVHIGNRKFGDRFLFGGFKTTQAPFDHRGNYRGDDGEMKIVVDKEASVAMNMPGNRVFLGQRHGGGSDGFTQSPQPSTSVNPSQSTHDSSSSIPSGEAVGLRGPAASQADLRSRSIDSAVVNKGSDAPEEATGVNVFEVLRNFKIGLKANDKLAIQDSLDQIEEALNQVVLMRSQLGARVMTLNSATETLSRGQVDSKTLASQLEDVDTFELVSDLNKSESTLKASLSTSSKLIQPSLLDFLR